MGMLIIVYYVFEVAKIVYLKSCQQQQQQKMTFLTIHVMDGK